ncbi:dihydrolipoyl dehydrogenase [Candidatus Palibaumannia cicadellinicola]|uniref:Dihydrolipoyl dehydrogenase n=1 Tax=Baumannia cicadellinicola subsp. Homalodisca coagulata TaxID=374463 RepID=Q1LSX3_BAUCH|nr:dihydrolipoyl dehydrogenase [Candidatus Baumannia cicadellinicola]ABF14285.1 pyruvate dehydrogenase complex, E3 component, dihydrolipoamide dehydrogenase [Baumannia cicadellinicola str. Hc (Homalodisca coagulata)]MBS0032560.1 dihydrolipoyl dehydrogenase [Candidatus Baumannia cicadellinicola]MCJ7462198.1 dihydrolipoyl dehydrogenase [Candidatus Baumannia cicadellinicola]MCJ7462911.1 dihydrolipoyl dehydrogenase [Candidatus Baumannia cicadellinicola]
MNNTLKTNVVIIGAGPAGYSAAFRCADLGLQTILVERYSKLGGVCLNVGCIPSKTLLHIAKVITETKVLSQHQLLFGEIKADLNQVRIWKDKIINQLTKNLYNLAQKRNITVINGYGKFINDKNIIINNNNHITNVIFDNAIIATGSSPITLPFLNIKDPRIWNSTDALTLPFIPKKMLVIGGGIIGIEMAYIYSTLGSEIDIIEMSNQIIPAADEDIANLFNKHIRNKFKLMLETKVTAIEPRTNGIAVEILLKDNKKYIQYYDVVLIAIGRIPNGKLLNTTQIGIKVDDFGFVSVDKQMRTNIKHIYAIGDIVSQPMLAHKGIHEGYVAAEVIADKISYFDPKVIPSIIYTEPEVAWTGITEKEAKNKNINYEKSIFPWFASGRAITSYSQDGMTKLIFEKNTRKIIGGAIIGTNGGELLGEISLAIEMGCDAEDIAMTIHAHPTLYESIGLSAKIYEGTIVDLLSTK